MPRHRATFGEGQWPGSCKNRFGGIFPANATAISKYAPPPDHLRRGSMARFLQKPVWRHISRGRQGLLGRKTTPLAVLIPKKGHKPYNTYTCICKYETRQTASPQKRYRESAQYFDERERTVFTTQAAVSTRPQPLRRRQWRRLRPYSRQQNVHNWHGIRKPE